MLIQNFYLKEETQTLFALIARKVTGGLVSLCDGIKGGGPYPVIGI
jgi:hypothetical protein